MELFEIFHDWKLLRTSYKLNTYQFHSLQGKCSPCLVEYNKLISRNLHRTMYRITKWIRLSTTCRYNFHLYKYIISLWLARDKDWLQSLPYLCSGLDTKSNNYGLGLDYTYYCSAPMRKIALLSPWQLHNPIIKGH